MLRISWGIILDSLSIRKALSPLILAMAIWHELLPFIMLDVIFISETDYMYMKCLTEAESKLVSDLISQKRQVAYTWAYGNQKVQMGIRKSKWKSERANGNQKEQMEIRKSFSNGNQKEQMGIRKSKWKSENANGNQKELFKWKSERANGIQKEQMGIRKHKWQSERAFQMGIRKSKGESVRANGNQKEQMGIRKSKWTSERAFQMGIRKSKWKSEMEEDIGMGPPKTLSKNELLKNIWSKNWPYSVVWTKPTQLTAETLWLKSPHWKSM